MAGAVFTQRVQRLGDAIGQRTQRSRLGFTRGEAEAGQIEGDDAVFRREQLELRRPILQAAGDPVQQQDRRIGGIPWT